MSCTGRRPCQLQVHAESAFVGAKANQQFPLGQTIPCEMAEFHCFSPANQEKLSEPCSMSRCRKIIVQATREPSTQEEPQKPLREEWCLPEGRHRRVSVSNNLSSQNFARCSLKMLCFPSHSSTRFMSAYITAQTLLLHARLYVI